MATRQASIAGATPRPFLKWAGGKAQLLPALLARVPAHLETYFEPFAGGGALFFALMAHRPTPRRAILNDLNPELIATYEVVRDTPRPLAARLATLEHEYVEADAAGREAIYYRMRAAQPRSPLEVAARVIFLNKTCFNGLYRVNREGLFNVPHGRYRAPHIADQETLFTASAALQSVDLRCTDFEEACADARPGDFVYFDPPFHPLSNTSSFTAYTQRDFNNADQIRLKRCVDALTARGVAVLVSNSPHPWIRGGYEFSGYNVAEVPARRAINSRGDRRGPIGELVISNAGMVGD
jgi:DNA adenine methylase